MDDTLEAWGLSVISKNTTSLHWPDGHCCGSPRNRSRTEQPSRPSTDGSAGASRVAHGDCPGGPIDRDGVEVEEAGKGHAFDEMWGIKGRE